MSVAALQAGSMRVAERATRSIERGDFVRPGVPPSAASPDAETDHADFSADALNHARKQAGTSEEDAKLTDAEQRQVEKLRARDAEVRAHEAAHMAAGGSHVTGGATYTYQVGPDGKSYAIGGEVGIDVSPVSGNPQATIQKMQQVRAAALAPGDPSGADRGVAAHAAQAEADAREQLASTRGSQASELYRRNAQGGAESAGLLEAKA